MKTPFHAAPATPGEWADPTINPDREDLGWIVADADDVGIPSFGDGYMCEHIATDRAAMLNRGRPGTDVVNDCNCSCEDEG